ncbi:hypothetical protein [Streptomyces sp. R08]|uniref:Uncharacterized protein n=1 Tax=Streptomyces sp. R08 TaxID=3238624 RepID=A0AB39MNY0_9ACTN
MSTDVTCRMGPRAHPGALSRQLPLTWGPRLFLRSDGMRELALAQRLSAAPASARATVPSTAYAPLILPDAWRRAVACWSSPPRPRPASRGRDAFYKVMLRADPAVDAAQEPGAGDH